MIKHLKNKSITDYYAACELEPFVRPSAERSLAGRKVQCIVRSMEPSDAPEISKCIYKAYGYSYAYEHTYYPERVIELNRKGDMLSAVAVTKENEIAGHCALLFWHENDPIAEMGQAVVKPEFRSQGILTKLTQYVIEKAKSRGLIGVFAQAVTVHTFSQKVAQRFGLKDCAIILGYFPKTETFKGIAEELTQRVGAVVSFRYLKKHRVMTIYPPPRHGKIISKLYKYLTIRPVIKAPTAPSVFAGEGSLVKTRLIGSMSFARVEIARYDQSIVKEIRLRLKELCLKRIEVINLYLNLCDPLTYNLTEEFEELGFFFAGILPGAVSDGDALILQYLNNVPVHYKQIKVVSGFAEELLSYVMAHDPNRV